MSGFSNPVTNSIGQLVRSALQSLGFRSGVQGWQISKSGAAEFNNALLRGNLVLGPSATKGPRIVLGNTLPSVLSTWAALHSITITAVILKYWNDTDFEWNAVGLFAGVNCTFDGTYDTVNGVYVITHTQIQAGPDPVNLLYGSTAVDTTPLGIVLLNTLMIAGKNDASRYLVGNETVTATTGNLFGGYSASNSIGVNAYADVPALPTWRNTFNKQYDETDIEITFTSTCWGTAANVQASFGVRLTGPAIRGDYDLARLTFNVTTAHLQVAGSRALGFALGTFPAGAYTVIPRWKNSGAAGNVVADGSDWVTMTVREVAGELHV